jgi:UDPglucose 6-dehydrogenase
MADAAGLHPQLLRAVAEINADMRRLFVRQAERQLGSLEGRVIGVLGLAFKQDTDDLRESPAVAIIAMLQERGASVRAYDPAAMGRAAQVLPDVLMCRDAYDAARGTDAVMLVTPWTEFKDLDISRLAAQMRGDLLLDGRNVLDATQVELAGLRYVGIGRRSRQAIATRNGQEVAPIRPALDPAT